MRYVQLGLLAWLACVLGCTEPPPGLAVLPIVEADGQDETEPYSFPSVLVVGAGGETCTGTLITPAHVLTAAHCFRRSGAVASVRVRDSATHPTADLAVADCEVDARYWGSALPRACCGRAAAELKSASDGACSFDRR